jgi:hypothetical protein
MIGITHAASEEADILELMVDGEMDGTSCQVFFPTLQIQY